jgi:DNA-binding CsgD family transcriptional regulator
VQIVGRETELAALDAHVSNRESPATLVLVGGPGSGKTTLWEAGVAAARARRWRVLAARASSAEAGLAFAALTDLLGDVETEELELPAPQRRALEVALLRAEAESRPPEPRAISLGFLSALRALAAGGQILVAIDDVPWLDPPSADALTFAARRLELARVSFLLTRRPGSPTMLARALEPGGLRRLEVGPLSLGATRQLLFEQLGLSLPRPVLRRLFEGSQGNPLFALELGRALAERGPVEIGEEIPVPETIEELLGTRVAGLPQPLRRLLLALALSENLRASQLIAIAGPVALESAVETGLLLLDGDRVRPSHPLLAAAARQQARAAERRELHLELAGVVADTELRALHLALATSKPDDGLASMVAAAAASASARGARQEAVELADHALRLTPAWAPERTERLLSLAEHLDMAGHAARVIDLLVPELETLPPGSSRVQAYLLLNRIVTNIDAVEHYFQRALAESEGDPDLRASVLSETAAIAMTIRVERIREAEAWALEAQATARSADAQRAALDALAWARALRGLPIDEVYERFVAVMDTAVYVAASPERVAGQRLAWRGEIDRARSVHARLRALADEHGETFSYALEGLHLCELELRAGCWEAASRLLDDVIELEGIVELSGAQGVTFPISKRCRALLAAGRGLTEEANRWVAEGLARAEASGGLWDRLELQRARGLGALLAHEPDAAVEILRQVWEHTRREGVDEPGVFPVAPELVEALVELGELDQARAVTARLRELAEQQEHPWGLASAKRCGALVQLSAAYDEEAAAELAEAAVGYHELGLAFDRARSLLVLGRAQRRHRKWAAARNSLEQAASAFDELGSPGWAEEARSELSRVGARRPRPAGELTPAERRVAELAAEGLANKEIAQALFVTVKTVEAHLSHAYEKLGVRSRTQLARRFSA